MQATHRNSQPVRKYKLTDFKQGSLRYTSVQVATHTLCWHTTPQDPIHKDDDTLQTKCNLLARFTESKHFDPLDVLGILLMRWSSMRDHKMKVLAD